MHGLHVYCCLIGHFLNTYYTILKLTPLSSRKKKIRKEYNKDNLFFLLKFINSFIKEGLLLGVLLANTDLMLKEGDYMLQFWRTSF